MIKRYNIALHLEQETQNLSDFCALPQAVLWIACASSVVFLVKNTNLFYLTLRLFRLLNA